ncbi:hypothetical protein RB195_003352 [Necator americanus]|uniref:Shugoshin C-terminal domain-containing protein n=1 Tax=Necator americanus TaxID=51031 RepID=A0ABR1DPN7_NECAM
MWWYGSDCANLLYFLLQCVSVICVLVLQTISFCSGRKESGSSKETVMATAILNDKDEKLASPIPSQESDASAQVGTKDTDSKERRGSAEENGSIERPQPKQVFPKRRKRAKLDPADLSESIKTEHTIYERRTKTRDDSAQPSMRLQQHRSDNLILEEPTQKVLSQEPMVEQLTDALNEVKTQNTQRPGRNVLGADLFEEDTQPQVVGSELPERQASSPRRRKSRRKITTLLPYQGTPVVHATASEKAARSKSSTPLCKQEISELGDGAGTSEAVAQDSKNDQGRG